jgi:uncharacterized GH25 family protein
VKRLWTAPLLIALAGGAQAHDSWLEPKSFELRAGASVPLKFYVGHHGEQKSASLSPRPRWLTSLSASGPSGRIDLLKTKGFNPAAAITLRTPGTTVVALDTADFHHEMTPAEFANYMDEEGLAGAKATLERRPIRGRKVREAYRRHAKALVQIGGSAAGPVTRRLGQRLEIVPSVSPYSLRAGDRLPAAIWYRDKPLAGALVTLGDLDRPKDPLIRARSDRQGKVAFALPRAGRWMMNVVWSAPAPAGRSDFLTSFSSLTFAVPAKKV